MEKAQQKLDFFDSLKHPTGMFVAYANASLSETMLVSSRGWALLYISLCHIQQSSILFIIPLRAKR